MRYASRHPISGPIESRIEQHDGADRAHRRTNPEAAVDHEIGPAAVARRHQFLNRRIDRGVFAADAGAGEKPEQRVARNIPGERGRSGGGEIDRQRDEEQFLAPDPVGEPAESERAEHSTGEIGAVGQSDIEIGEFQRRAFFERARQGARQRDLQPIQNPGDAERQHDAGVKAAPGEIVEPRRNAGFDDAIVASSGRNSGACRKDLRLIQTSHAASLQCLPRAISTETGASIGWDQCGKARKCEVPRLSGGGDDKLHIGHAEPTSAAGGSSRIATRNRPVHCCFSIANAWR